MSLGCDFEVTTINYKQVNHSLAITYNTLAIP